MYLIGFPLLVIPFAIYNMIAFLTPSLSWTDKVATFHLVSGQDWPVTPEAILLFIAMLVEFLLVARAGTSTFFILMVISLVDTLAGFIITARTASRDIEINRADPTI